MNKIQRKRIEKWRDALPGYQKLRMSFRDPHDHSACCVVGVALSVMKVNWDDINTIYKGSVAVSEWTGMSVDDIDYIMGNNDGDPDQTWDKQTYVLNHWIKEGSSPND